MAGSKRRSIISRNTFEEINKLVSAAFESGLNNSLVVARSSLLRGFVLIGILLTCYGERLSLCLDNLHLIGCINQSECVVVQFGCLS